MRSEVIGERLSSRSRFEQMNAEKVALDVEEITVEAIHDSV